MRMISHLYILRLLPLLLLASLFIPAGVDAVLCTNLSTTQGCEDYKPSCPNGLEEIPEDQCHEGYCCGELIDDISGGVSSKDRVIGAQCASNFQPAGSGDTYQEVCELTANITVQGYVTDQDGFAIGGADVDIKTTEASDSNITDTNGFYEGKLGQSINTKVNVTANTADCDENTTTTPNKITIGDTVTVNVTLNCQDSGTGGTEPPEGTNPGDGSSTTCVVDGIINFSAGEECDPDADAIPGNPTCDPDIGQVICSDECNIIRQCTACPSDVSACTTDLCECGECSGLSMCEAGGGTCEFNSDLNVNIDREENPDNELITVSYPTETCSYDENIFANITIDPVPQSDDLDEKAPYTVIEWEGESYSFPDAYGGGQVLRGYNTTFTVEAVYENASGAKKYASGVGVYQFKSEFCAGKPPGSSWCEVQEVDGSDVEGVTTCASGGESFSACEGEEICIPFSGNAVCDKVSCEDCNGAYDAFPGTGHVAGKYSCSLLLEQNACYVSEYSPKQRLFGSVSSCSSVLGCGDYTDRDSCVNDACNRSVKCSWKNTSENLGTGFCVSEDDSAPPTDHQCTSCAGSSCDEEFCELSLGGGTGKACLFNIEQTGVAHNNETCMPRSRVICNTYDDKTQCTNSTPFHLHGNHSRNLSDDELGLGICTWKGSPNGCIRDVDLDGVADCGVGSSVDIECARDITPPETTLLGLANLQTPSSFQERINFFATDNRDASGDIKTIFSFDDENGTAQHLKNHVAGLDLEQPRNLSFMYWSKDAASNLEIKNNHTVELVADLADELNLTVHTSTGLIGNTRVLNLTLSIGEVKDDRSLTCTASVEADAEDGFKNNAAWAGEHNTTFAYTNLEAGTYEIQTACTDNLGGSWEATDVVVLDGDLRITNPYPNISEVTIYQVNENKPISIEANSSAECQYKQIKDGALVPGDWNNFSGQNGDIHTAEPKLTDLSDQGVIAYQVRCEFNPGEGHLYGDAEDEIVFGVDNIPPQVTDEYYDSQGNTILRSEAGEYGEITVKLTCDSEHPPYAEYKTKWFSYACAENPIQYCVYTSDEEGCTPNTQYTTQFTIQSPETEDATTNIRVEVKDVGGNKRLRTFSLTPRKSLASLVDLNVKTNEYRVSNQWKGSITAEVGTLQGDQVRDFTCNFQYSGPEGFEESFNEITGTTNVSHTIQDLTGGEYQVTATCTDKVTEFEKTVPANLDTDRAIHDATPSPEDISIHNVGDDVDISLGTDGNATRCEYYRVNEENQVIEGTGDLAKGNFSGQGTTEHTKTLRVEASELYRYKVRCLFQDDTVWTNGTASNGVPGDFIMFAGDDKPPALTYSYTDESGTEIEDPTQAQEVTVTLKCDAQNHNDYKGSSFSFPCDPPIKYCTTTAEGCNPETDYNETEKFTVSPPQEQTVETVVSTVSDTGGNVAEENFSVTVLSTLASQLSLEVTGEEYLNDSLGEWQGELDVELSEVADNRNITCTFTTRETSQNTLTDSRTVTEQNRFSYSLRGLRSGVYNVEADCQDTLDWTFNSNASVALDTDRRITNAQPNSQDGKTLFAEPQDVEISVETNETARCQYIERSPEETEDYVDFSDTNDVRHTATVNADTGVYYYEVRCEFEDDDQYTLGDPSDRIVFGVDDEAPSVAAELLDENRQPIEDDTGLERVRVRLECVNQDHNALEIDGGTEYFTYQCTEMQYCVSEEASCNPDTEYTDSILVEPPEDNVDKYITVRTTDEAGNTGIAPFDYDLINTDFVFTALEVQPR